MTSTLRAGGSPQVHRSCFSDRPPSSDSRQLGAGVITWNPAAEKPGLAMHQTDNVLSERHIQDSFHSYLKSSLTQAKAERLLDADILSSAESDLMITGPALCLYFAALRCTTNPPSVPLPRSGKSEAPIDLSFDNCPPAFAGFLRVWAHTVPAIQSLIPEYQHDLARVICGLEPLSQPVQPAIGGIAADLRAVAIEISQRRSFQDRFASDLQAALDSGTVPGSPGAKKASFVPPPLYDSSPSPSPRPELERPLPPSPTPSAHSIHLSPSPSASTSAFPHQPRSPSPSSPALLAPTSPAIDLIRETLYASLADALERHPALRTLLKCDPPRAYFTSVSFAILAIATTRLTSSGAVLGILGTTLTLAECPHELRPFMRELAVIGREARKIEQEDSEVVVGCMQRGEEVPRGQTRMERVRTILEEGVEWSLREGRRDGAEVRRSVQGRAVAFANRINALSLGMTRLRAFRERQDEVFKVLAGVGT
ncbi:hypothetical protein C0995_012062 [Termitomyces sp. Mi166|nr:hypothetical protein C0995_012062 [Termitomyces sp. Mi166\